MLYRRSNYCSESRHFSNSPHPFYLLVRGWIPNNKSSEPGLNAVPSMMFPSSSLAFPITIPRSFAPVASHQLFLVNATAKRAKGGRRLFPESFQRFAVVTIVFSSMKRDVFQVCGRFQHGNVLAQRNHEAFAVLCLSSSQQAFQRFELEK
jgi:hypothetical protein